MKGSPTNELPIGSLNIRLTPMPRPTKVVSDIMSRAADGKIFSVTFVKRTNGEVRDMVCRLGVEWEGGWDTEGHREWEPSDYDLMQVYDMQKQGYRMINLPKVLELRADGDRIIYNYKNNT